jgi:hypothetical protein
MGLPKDIQTSTDGGSGGNGFGFGNSTEGWGWARDPWAGVGDKTGQGLGPESGPYEPGGEGGNAGFDDPNNNPTFVPAYDEVNGTFRQHFVIPQATGTPSKLSGSSPRTHERNLPNSTQRISRPREIERWHAQLLRGAIRRHL